LPHEARFRLALNAPSQCPTTLETLAAIKNPPIVYDRQANVTTGPQQADNGDPSHAPETEIPKAKLSGDRNDLLPDAGHRRLRAELIRDWSPWEKSTGPRMPEGNPQVSLNAYRGGRERCCETIDAPRSSRSATMIRCGSSQENPTGENLAPRAESCYASYCAAQLVAAKDARASKDEAEKRERGAFGHCSRAYIGLARRPPKLGVTRYIPDDRHS
jgi:hypothetical protein